MAGFLSDLVQYRKLLLMIMVLGIGGTHLSGFQMSVINYTSPYIQKFINETWLERYGSVLQQETLTLLWSLIVSMYCVGGMIGCLCSGLLTAKYGKKKCLLFNDVVLIIATLHTGFSRRAKSFEMILIGRFLEGIGAGIHLNAHVQYAGEISPKRLRGFVNVSCSVFLALGKAVARILGLRDLLGTEDMWNVLLSFSGLVALIQLVFLPFFPESPPYLLMQKGDKAGCLKAMKQLWGEENYLTEFDDMMKEKAITKGTKIMNVLEMLKEPSVYPQLSTMLLILLSLQLCGLSADQFLWMRYCSVILIFLFVIAYGLGPAGAVMSVMNEIFTLSTRSSAFVIGGIIIWLGLTFTGMIFPFAVIFLGPFCFLIFIAVLVISAVLIYLFLPETKGKSTSEITGEFKKCQFKKKRRQTVEKNATEEKTFCTKL
ncbi:solute carrier family 2, facilitated glucose transporter member 5-like isoform X4 [Strigops habroptila]|uniref:solute carrier family 2, facilitated glucose transporter member 5-like isoform X4 n=1 Tax=Strigops habroptila TaxID=2489341 RepID=UPI0011CFC539|nr:solute carrier family 2, facilitated glucose transporter member 5-like isoform X4 [Strigops habroptila]